MISDAPFHGRVTLWTAIAIKESMRKKCAFAKYRCFTDVARKFRKVFGKDLRASILSMDLATAERGHRIPAQEASMGVWSGGTGSILAA